MNRPLPVVSQRPPKKLPANYPEIVSELQALGMRWLDQSGPGLSRAGGAGPSDHKAVTIANQTVMVPILNHASRRSPYAAQVLGDYALLLREGEQIAVLAFPKKPRFYERSTADGVPYWKIATLHGQDVLATTVLQTCMRYGNRTTSCQFCAIGQSLAAKSTIAEKTPAQLAEVAKAAVELDGVQHLVMTTGTPQSDDRGARVLADAARAVRAAVALPIQAQCEPPADFVWFSRLAQAGVDSLGLHLEAVSEEVRRRVIPGKAEVPVSFYLEAFAAAVREFGRGQVSSYILAGLGDSRETIVDMCERMIALGVYPFVVPFVPIAGTPLADHPTPEPAFMANLLADVARLLARSDLRSSDVKAGCARCGACSSLKAREALDA
jgi:radical SAM protein (TIGR04043 family)